MSAAYANYPLGTPPPGVEPNFIDPPSQREATHIAMGICMAVSSIFILLRVYTKAFVSYQWSWEDLCCVFGWICIVTHDSLAFTLLGPGPGKLLGVHFWDLQVKDIGKAYIQRTDASLALYAGGALFVKLSLFLLYFRLFKPNALTRWLVLTGIPATTIFYGACIILNLALCLPSPSLLNSEVAWETKASRCSGDSKKIALAQGIFGTISDVYLLVIPIQMVLRLKMETKRKLGVCAIFLTGLIGVACSIGSLVYRARLMNSTDQTWISADVYMFSNAEIAAGIVCSCAPILAALFKSSSSSKHPRIAFSLRYFMSRSSLGSRRRVAQPQPQRDDNAHAEEKVDAKGPAVGSAHELDELSLSEAGSR